MIDLEKILNLTGLDAQTVAAQLFPKNNYPMAALTRVLKGETYLDSAQILELSALTGLSVEELFTVHWRAKAEKGLIHFQNGEFKAVLNLEENTTRIYRLDSLIFETVFTAKSITLREYLAELNKVINQNK